MAGVGGYQAPRHPAPVSGPGALARRTDGGPADKQRQKPADITGGAYGDRKQLAELQASAPLAADNPSAAAAGAMPLPDPGQLPPMVGPSQRPDEPVTAGVDFGAGPGSDVLGAPNLQAGDNLAMLQYLPALEDMANQPGSTPSLRALVFRLKGAM